MLPVGGFLLAHLIHQAGQQSLAADSATAAAAGDSATPMLVRAVVLLSLVFHGLLGLVLVAQSRLNVRRYPYGPNWNYAFQRVTGVLVLAFLVLHVVDVVWPLAQGSMIRRDVYRAMTARLSSTQAGVPWWALGYLLGIAACAYHLAAGLHRAARTWGLATTRRGLQRIGLACSLLGLTVLLVGGNTTVMLATGSAISWPWATNEAAAPAGAGVACSTATANSAAADSAKPSPRPAPDVPPPSVAPTAASPAP